MQTAKNYFFTLLTISILIYSSKNGFCQMVYNPIPWPKEITSEMDNQINQAIAYNSNCKEHFIIWQSEHSQAGKVDSYSIKGVRVRLDGVTIGSKVDICSKTSQKVSEPDIIYNYINDEYLIVYVQHSQNDLDKTYISAKRISPSGKQIGTSLKLSGFGIEHRHPKVRWDMASNEYFIIWSETDEKSKNSFVTGTRLSGRNLAIYKLRNKYIFPPNSFEHDIAGIPGSYGQYLAVCTYKENDGDYNIISRFIKLGAKIEFENIGYIVKYNKFQRHPSVAYNRRDREFMVLWEDHRNENGSDSDILGVVVAYPGIFKSGILEIASNDYYGDKQRRFRPKIAYNWAFHEFHVTYEYSSNSNFINSVYGSPIKAYLRSPKTSTESRYISTKGSSYGIAYSEGASSKEKSYQPIVCSSYLETSLIVYNTKKLNGSYWEDSDISVVPINIPYRYDTSYPLCLNPD
jgi:hypothetical protein